MANLVAPFYTFKSGVLSRKLLGQQGLKIINSGLLQGDNFITQVQGGQEYRFGFKYVRPTRANKPATLWPFIFNPDQSFVLEFTDYFLRFHAKEGTIVEGAKNIIGVTQASPGVVTVTSHGYTTGQEVFIDNIEGMDELNGKFYLVVSTGANTFTLQNLDGVAVNTTAFTAYVSGGTAKRVYEISTPYTQVQAENLMFSGAGDLRYLVDGVHMPRKLIRNANTNWTLQTYTRTNDPLDQRAITGITQANPAVVTAPAHGYTTGDEVYIEDVTGMTQLNNRYFKVTVINANTFSLNGENSTGHTAYGSGGIVSLAGNAPRAVGIYGAALYFGGSDNDPEVFHKSRQPDTTTGAPRYDDFTVGSAPEDAVTLPLESLGEVTPQIQFFVGTRSFLAVGMQGGMSKINGGVDNKPVTSKDIGTFPLDSVGVERIRPVSFGNDMIYVQRGGEVLLSFRYNLANDGFEAFDLTIHADEILRTGVRQLAVQQGRPNLIWVLLNDGRLRSVTYQRAEDVVAWNPHTLGGTIGDDLGVISICPEPQLSNNDRLWACVKRRINGTVRYFLEVTADNPYIPEPEEFYTGDKAKDNLVYRNMMWEAQRRQIHLDSALILDTTQATTLTLAALEGDDILFTAGASVFSADDEGTIIRVRYLDGDEAGIAEVVEYVSPTEVRCAIGEKFNALTYASGEWYLCTKKVRNLDHLEGEEVDVVEDGAPSNSKTVVDGEITLDDPAAVVMVGKRYRGILETMPIELLLSTGITSGAYKTVGLFKPFFRHTLGPKYGIDPYALNTMKFREGNDFTGRPAPLFTGYQDLPGFDGYSLKKTYLLVQDTPTPCKLMGMVLDLEVPFE